MFNKDKIPLFVSLFFLISTPAFAELLWPLETGTVYEFSNSDNSGANWTAQIGILEEATLGSKKYNHVRLRNYWPGDLEDIYVRSTDTALYGWTGNGEGLILKIGPVGTTFFDGTDDDVFVEIIGIEPVTVPYGGPYTAYVYRKYDMSENSPFWYNYLVPGLGMLKEVHYWSDNPPMVMELTRICHDGVADFTSNTVSGSAPLTVNFTDQSCGIITSWSWDFGDGSTSSEQNPSHTYTIPGIYTVSLTVIGPGGSDEKTEVDFISVSQRTRKAMPFIPLLLDD